MFSLKSCKCNIRLLFKFIGGYAAKCTFVMIDLHFVYKIIEFAACFPWKVASVLSDLYSGLSVAMQPNALFSLFVSFFLIKAD